MSIRENLRRVQAEINQSVSESGRMPHEVQLIVVSKTYGIEAIMEAYEAGIRDFGENKVQELCQKQPNLPADIRWHLIGHLQRNKVKYIAPFIHCIHSVDSEKLLEEINSQAAHHQRQISCLLQIHISGEPTKSGMQPQEAVAILQGIDRFPHVMIEGFMGMASLTDDRSLILKEFHSLAQLVNTLDHPPSPRIRLHHLSMGMSGDYDLALQEGATMLRIGSAIFGRRN